LNALTTGKTSLNDDQPGEMTASSKSSMKASRWEFVRMRVPLLAQTPEPTMVPDEDEEPELELELEPEAEPEPELEPVLLPKPPLDEPLLVEPTVPEELPLPELPLDELPGGAPGTKPLAHPPVRQRLAARRETWAVVGIFCELSNCIIATPTLRSVPTEMAPGRRPSQSKSWSKTGIDPWRSSRMA
jgi:hypothetical protein